MKNIILTDLQIRQKTKRIAYQIYELNYNEKEIVIAGISNNGYLFAKQIVKELKEISGLKIKLCEVIIDKKNPLNLVKTNLESKEYENKSLVLVDDVLNSGTTLMYGVKHFLEVSLKCFKTAVLVDRNHKKYPVKADFKGISLSTSLQEHVIVDFENNNYSAYLE